MFIPSQQDTKEKETKMSKKSFKKNSDGNEDSSYSREQDKTKGSTRGFRELIISSSLIQEGIYFVKIHRAAHLDIMYYLAQVYYFIRIIWPAVLTWVCMRAGDGDLSKLSHI